MRVALLAAACIAVASGCGSDVSVPAPDRASVDQPTPAATLDRPQPSTGGSSTPAATTAAPSAASPSSSPATPFGFAAKGMSHEVVAFATVPQLPYVADRMDFSAVSTVAYFGLTATASGSIDLANAGGRAWTSETMSRVISRAHAVGSRVIATIGRFSWNAAGTRTSRAVLSSSARRQRLAETVADLVIDRGVDGVNLDFEPIPSGLAGEYADLVGRVRRALDARRPGLQLTVALVGQFDSYDVPALVAARPDALYLMGYHFSGWWSTVAGSTAPLGGARYDVTDAVRLLRRSVPADRLIVGMPYYGHVWPTASGEPHARTTGRGSDVSVATGQRLADAHGVRWDPVEHVAWSRWQARDCDGCALHWMELYYDDPRATADKLAWIDRERLLGAGIWTIGFEGAPGPWNAELRRAVLDR